MAFNDDSFIREVNEELRSDQMKSVWKRFGPLLIGLAGLIVVGTAAERGYAWWSNRQASAAGDTFLAAMDLASQNKTAEAEAALAAIEKDGYGAYPVLARMRAATLEAQKGDAAKAIADFTEIGKDTAIPEAIRDTANLRAAYLLVDTGSYEQVSAAAEALATPQNALRHSAREVLGLAAYKNGDFKRAREWFQSVVDDKDAPGNVARRAEMLLDLIASSGKAS